MVFVVVLEAQILCNYTNILSSSSPPTLFTLTKNPLIPIHLYQHLYD